MAGILDPEAAKAAFSILEARRSGGLPGPGDGASAWAWLSGRDFFGLCSGLPESVRARYGLGDARGCLVAALAYSEGPPEPPAWARGLAGPLAGLGRFARANWYGELLARLNAMAGMAKTGLEAAGFEAGPPSAWRALANSGLPERALALAAGLGSRGVNQLLIAGRPGEEGRLGPGVVLGLLLLPFDPEDLADPRALGRPLEGLGPDFLDPACAACGACAAACPSSALDGRGGFDREACVQHWTTKEGPLPPGIEAVWGRRLYGCDACLEACPLFRPGAMSSTDRGLLGPGLPSPWLAGASDAEVKAVLRGSALGLGWMPAGAWRRNARLCLKQRLII